MKFRCVLRRSVILLSSLLLLTALVTAAELPTYTMTVHEGFICVKEMSSGDWIYCTRVRADMLPPADQLLLEAGVPLCSQAEFTSAVEDFCS